MARMMRRVLREVERQVVMTRPGSERTVLIISIFEQYGSLAHADEMYVVAVKLGEVYEPMCSCVRWCVKISRRCECWVIRSLEIDRLGKWVSWKDSNSVKTKKSTESGKLAEGECLSG